MPNCWPSNWHRRAWMSDLQTVACKQDFAEALASFVPDVVVSDSNLPGFSGLQALDLVRASMPGTPFVFLTGNMPRHPDAIAGSHRANGFLSKDDMGAAPGLLASLLASQA